MRELEKAQRLALRIRSAIVLHHRWTMPVEHCYALGSDLGMDAEAVHRFLLQNPGAFPMVSCDVKFSSTARDLVSQERQIPKEPYAAFVIRKLLMLSQKEMLPTAKLLRCECFDFPELTRVFSHNPSFFHWDRARLLWGRLRLVSWDPELAITAREKTLATLRKVPEEEMFGAGSGIIPLENDGGMETIQSPQELARLYRQPMISPYDRSRFSVVNKELERHRKMSVIHEFLSLTRSKSAAVSDLHDFHQELGLDEQRQDLESLLRSDKRFFTMKMSLGRMVVFLNERYDLDHTPALSPYFQAKRRFLDLITIEESSATAMKAI
ncbi:hypothetical protein SELMODRAFT_451388 [Selaginella moellendorffii]|uniref:Uncharacterized protein RPD1L8-1 n=2 Tax=Selaginella moellendorffii TaxID=88036 RepID=D8SFQ7_SELML|nr:hypothetical protein SELMODRAFT_451388 [Selaginella moellendorffii]